MKPYSELYGGVKLPISRHILEYKYHAGFPDEMHKCIAECNDGWQCTRYRGYGPDGMFCKQHGKKARKLEDGK